MFQVSLTAFRWPGKQITTIHNGENQAEGGYEFLHTNNEQRDAHLRNSDFFEADKHPEMIFESTKTEQVDKENFNLYGNLTLKSVTLPVRLNVEYSGITKDPWGGERAGFYRYRKNQTQRLGVLISMVYWKQAAPYWAKK
ncbi:MAG: YceI family protein [Puia sp.]